VKLEAKKAETRVGFWTGTVNPSLQAKGHGECYKHLQWSLGQSHSCHEFWCFLNITVKLVWMNRLYVYALYC